MAKQLGILVDVKRCIGCRACSIACKAQHLIPEGSVATYINETSDGVFPNVKMHLTKISCLHCGDATCVKVCPTGSLYKTVEGIVADNHEKCIGCKYCVTNCPFEIPQYNFNTGKVYKCDMCVNRISMGDKPACVSTCPCDALQFGELKDIETIAKNRLNKLKSKNPKANIYQPESVGGTSVFYVLTDEPSKFGLVSNPKIPASVGVWQDIIKPYGGWLIPLALLGSATSFVTTRILANKNEDNKGGGH